LQPETSRLIKLIAKNTAQLLGLMAVGAAYIEMMFWLTPLMSAAITAAIMLVFAGYIVYHVSKDQLAAQLQNEKRIADRLSRED
jgi:FtsH-binding integral membrane protein